MHYSYTRTVNVGADSVAVVRLWRVARGWLARFTQVIRAISPMDFPTRLY